MEYNVNNQVTVGTSSIVVSEERYNRNALRSSIILINTSLGGQKITISVDTPATANQGIVIAPGGYWQDSKDNVYIPTQRQINAVADGAGALLSIQERVEG